MFIAVPSPLELHLLCARAAARGVSRTCPPRRTAARPEVGRHSAERSLCLRCTLPVTKASEAARHPFLGRCAFGGWAVPVRRWTLIAGPSSRCSPPWAGRTRRGRAGLLAPRVQVLVDDLCGVREKGSRPRYREDLEMILSLATEWRNKNNRVLPRAKPCRNSVV